MTLTLVLAPEGVEEGNEEVEGDGQMEGDAHPQGHVTTEPVQQAARWQHSKDTDRQDS